MKIQRTVQLDEHWEKRLIRERLVPSLTLAYPDADAPEARAVRALANGTEMTARLMHRVQTAVLAIREVCERESDPAYWEEIVPGTGSSGLVLDHEVARATLAEARAQQLQGIEECQEIISRAAGAVGAAFEE